jgi:hypothetical protein
MKDRRRKCFWCGSKDREVKPVTLWGGKRAWYCIDSAACVTDGRK